jgi:hypothetical protein
MRRGYNGRRPNGSPQIDIAGTGFAGHKPGTEKNQGRPEEKAKPPKEQAKRFPKQNFLRPGILTVSRRTRLELRIGSLGLFDAGSAIFDGVFTLRPGPL